MQDIGIIIPLLHIHGGAERFAIECVARWQRVCAITLYATQFDFELLRSHGIDIAQVRCVTLAPLFDGPQELLLNSVLPKIWEQQIGVHDLYHAHQWPTHMIDRHPMVWFPHEPRRSLYDMLEPPAHAHPMVELTQQAVRAIDQFGRPDRVVANSRYTARYLEEVYGRAVPDVVYPGVNPAEALSLPAEPDLVSVVGYLGSHKRIDLLLDAIALAPGIRFHIAGDGPERANLERRAKDLGIADRVRFLGVATNHDIQSLLARSLAVLFAPIREPFGIVALEAIAAGRPLIAVDEGGYTEAVDDSCAFLVPPEAGAFAERIRYLRDHPEIARRMGEAGRVRAAAFTWDRTASELLAILRDTHRSWQQNARAAQPTRSRAAASTR